MDHVNELCATQSTVQITRPGLSIHPTNFIALATSVMYAVAVATGHVQDWLYASNATIALFLTGFLIGFLVVVGLCGYFVDRLVHLSRAPLPLASLQLELAAATAWILAFAHICVTRA